MKLCKWGSQYDAFYRLGPKFQISPVIRNHSFQMKLCFFVFLFSLCCYFLSPLGPINKPRISYEQLGLSCVENFIFEKGIPYGVVSIIAIALSPFISTKF